MDDDIMSNASSRPCNDPRVFPDLMGSSLANLPYEPFIMDFDTEMDLSPFGMPHMSGIPPPASGSLPGFEAETKTIDTAILQDLIEGNSPMDMPTPSGLFSHSDLSSMQAPSLAPDSLMSSTIPTTAKNSPSEEIPLIDFSSTACYQSLSNLNLRILASTAKTGPTANNSAVILKDVVGFSGELIETARQSMPYFIGSLHQNRGSIGQRTNSSSSGSEDGFSSTDSYISGAQAGSVPESAVIFLLLGCYTQILHLFEVTTNCLWEQHCENAHPDHPKEDNSGTVGSLLEASLAIHTVTYLLSRLHRALAVGEGPLEDEASSIDPHSWKKSFVGGKELEDGLLGRAFGEIRHRELWLMQRTQHLQRRINTCRI
ncbi:Ascofuranone/ascochlorin biosynthesis clusters transcription regulator ascR [Emericellopsis cladophorae]|uniref:Ascofuranone/ascochlorin biosynthesis clusters transcription regulator ascR n=1 Tax=Emericellopsis cladophorae TaxID=2686198 RepID=A0A9Q0BDF4_9HYPO|nr:Ascofuranone/ascochlorin biosynthesis clusters transcription regulator ascR [Emericellopsis cladophorae]KAI6781327.1 Ascofuranone/ascochlorin biosynthesis clusters transcription regulator ascR [Emericellopsis cladophorae]